MRPEATSSYSATVGLPFDDEELESNLVWIWGSPRTGSTWLLEMLCHPFEVNTRTDVGFGWREGWSGEAPALPVNEFMIASHLVAMNGVAMLDDGTLIPDSLNHFFSSLSSYAFSSAYENVWRPEVRRLILVRLFAVVARAREAGVAVPGKLPLLVIKEVNASHGADLVMSLFPRSKMIFLVRDGRDVLDSLLDAGSPKGWMKTRESAKGAFETDDERGRFVRENCLNWAARMNVCMQAYEGHDPDLRRQVRYEDLLADTEGRLGELARWLELPAGPRRMENIANAHSFQAIPDDMKGPGKIRRTATPGGWREGLTPEEQELAHEIMGDLLAKLGYEP